MPEFADIAIHTAFRVLGLMPRAGAVRIGNAIGRVWLAVDAKHRMIADANLSRAFGDEMTPADRRRLVRRVFANIARIPFEIGWSLHITPRRFSRYFRVDGIEHLTRAAGRGRGVLVLTAHTGNWELLPLVFGMTTGAPSNIIYRPLDYPPMDRFLMALRARYGAQMIPKAHSMRRVLRSLKAGELVGVLLDQNVDWYDGVFVPFFNDIACTNRGLALLAARTGAPVVPAFLVREGDGYRAIFEPEVPMERTGDKIRDLEANTARCNRVIEGLIRRYPDQWFWVHQRWKTRPSQPWPRVPVAPKPRRRRRRRRHR